MYVEQDASYLCFKEHFFVLAWYGDSGWLSAKIKHSVTDYVKAPGDHDLFSVGLIEVIEPLLERNYWLSFE